MGGVQAHELMKRFGSAVAVDGVSFEIASEQFATLLGASGCGKTTTLRMLAGLESPDSGAIHLGGISVFDRALNVEVAAELRRIGMVFQSYALWPHMTVARNVAFPLRARKTPHDDIASQVNEALRIVHMEELADRYPGELSGGQQQRVALARAIVDEPRLLLLDEPLSNLDATLREEMRTEVRALQQRLGITTLMVTHDQTEALAVSDVVMVMRDGRIIQSGTPRELYEKPKDRFVAGFVGWRNALTVAVTSPQSVTFGNTKLDGIRVHCATRDAVLMMRPEDLLVRTPREGDTLVGSVRAALYLATHVALDIELFSAPGGTTLIAHVEREARFARGDRVAIDLIPGRAIALAADS